MRRDITMSRNFIAGITLTLAIDRCRHDIQKNDAFPRCLPAAAAEDPGARLHCALNIMVTPWVADGVFQMLFQGPAISFRRGITV